MATSAPPSIAKIVHGPMFIGTVVNAILYGISITQTYFYITSFKNDRIWMKLFILVIFVADTANTVFDIQYMYSSLVNNYDSPVAIQKANWVFATDPAMTSIIGTMVQLFFSWRVKVLTNNTPVVCLLAFGSIISGLGGIATSIAIGMVPDWLEFQKFEAPVIVWLTASAAVDTTITVILVAYLRRHKTGFMGSDDVMNKIIRLTVQTGLVTSMWAIVDLGVYLGIPTGLHLAFNFPLSKLYSNSLLSSLNSRRGWKFSTMSDSDQKSPMHVATSATNFLRNMQHPDQVVSFNTSTVRPEVYIDVESHEMRDTVEKKTRLDVPENHDCKDVQKPDSDPAAMV
ncbi:hypothetical protein EWM64_g153 [Hericium alpestre]|uniref:DUF6534 domain-containing protein n=1 Tax=Hericium alpestre TaxID=135208 RepID=A0A4Z0A9X5_9AGAM|nr:hypothetical protein EWM64_g153 [Hericium alpestre]